MTTGEVIAIIGSIFGILISALAVAAMIRKSGKIEQKFEDGIKRLDEWHIEDQKKLSQIADDFKTHVNAPGIHVNPVVEQREYDQRVRFQEEVKSKLQKLLEK